MKKFYNLRVRFAECEVSQQEVARAAKIAPSTLSARMNGTKPFTSWEMEKIAVLLRIEPQDFYRYFFDRSRKA